jgi:tetratricopeptide (TPR) repeat protein
MRNLSPALCAFAAIAVSTSSVWAADGAVTLVVSDRLGRTAPAVAVLSGADGKEVARSSKPGDPAHVAPGNWFVAPAEAPEHKQAVAVADGAAVTVKLAAGDSVWLRFYNGDKQPYSYLLMRQKKPDALAQLLPRLRFVGSRSSPAAMPRPGFTDEQRAAALKIARAELAKPVPASKPDDPNDPPWRAARDWASRILYALGEAPDGDYWMTAAAENRQGRLGDGKTAEAARGTGNLAVPSALALYAAGYSSAGPVLLAATADAKHPEVFRTLLQFPAQSVSDRMVAGAEHFVARNKELGDKAHDEWNTYRNAAIPALLFLLAHGPDDVLAKLLDNLDLDSDEIPIVAAAAADPGQFADLLIAGSGLDEAKSANAFEVAAIGFWPPSIPSSLSLLCGAAETLTPAEANAMWARLFQTVSQRVAVKDKAFDNGTGDPARYGYYAAGNFFTRAGHCLTNRWILGTYLAQNGGNWSGWIPLVDWIPFYWDEQKHIDAVVAGAAKNISSTSPFAEQLDLISHPRLEELLTAKGDAGKAWPLDVYRAYHAVASHANGAFPTFPIRVASDADRRPYVMGRTKQPGTYDSVVNGIAYLRPELVDSKLRLHLKLEQVIGYSAHFQMFGQDDLGGQYRPSDGGQRYFIDRGRALVEAIKVWRKDTATAATPAGIDADGDLVYEMDAGSSGVEGMIVELDLAYFDDRRQLVFPIYGGDYSVRVRRAAALAEGAQGLALARVEAARGRVTAAADAYRKLLEPQPSEPALWLEAADLQWRMENYGAAAEVLRSGLTATKGDGDVLKTLADAEFLAGSYRESAAHFDELVKRVPDDPNFRVWLGLVRLLSDDLAGAEQALASLPAASQTRLVAQLRLLIAEWGPEAGRAAARERYAAYAATQKGKPEEAKAGLLAGLASPDSVLGPTINLPTATADARCDAELWVGELSLIQGRADDAMAHFEAATTGCRRSQYQYHLARQSAARLAGK